MKAHLTAQTHCSHQSVCEKMSCTLLSVLCKTLRAVVYPPLPSRFIREKMDIFLLCQPEHEFEQFFYICVCTLVVRRRWRRMTTITTMSMMTVITFLKEPSSHLNMWPSIFRKTILNCLPAKGRKKTVKANAIDLSVIVSIVTGHVKRIAATVECHTSQVACLCPCASMEMRWITHRI